MTRGSTVNGRIIAARRERGWTQKQFARRARLNHVDIVRMEQGWRPPAPIRLRVARALDATEDALFGAVR